MSAPYPPNGQYPYPQNQQPYWQVPPQQSQQVPYGYQHPYPNQVPYPYPVYPQQRVTRPPSRYGWGTWAVVIGSLMLFAGISGATTTADSCSPSTQSYSEYSDCVDAKGTGIETPSNDGALALVGVGGLGSLLLGLGTVRCLAVGTRVDALGKSVRGMKRSPRPPHTPVDHTEPVYDYEEPPYVREFPVEPAPEPQAPAPTSEPAPRAREGWGARRGLDFGGDDS